MSFSRFMSLLAYRALWFSKLNVLQDNYEGMIPVKLKRRLHEDNQKVKAMFNAPEYHRQIDEWLDRNEEDSRELLVVNCWFLGEHDSALMWREYGRSDDAVAIKSTIGRLSRCVFVPRSEPVSQLGLVSYVDHDEYHMSGYEAHQGHERAFLKDRKFAHEQEARIVTMNWKTTGCVSMDGAPYTAQDVAGAKSNNFENPGLYIGIRLGDLMTEVVLAPGAQGWLDRLVKRILELSGLPIPVSRSSAGQA